MMVVAYRQRKEGILEVPDGSTFSRRIDTILQTSRDFATFSAPQRLNRIDGDTGFGAISATTAGSPDGLPTVFLGDYIGLATAHGHTYVVRAEAVRANASEASSFPATIHHQRIWIASTDTGGPAVVATPGVPAAPVALPNTRLMTDEWRDLLVITGLPLVGLLLTWIGWFVRRRDRQTKHNS